MSFKHFFLILPLSIIALSGCRSRNNFKSVSESSSLTSQEPTTSTQSSSTSQGPQYDGNGFKYVLWRDNEYCISNGNNNNFSQIVIPATFNGKNVTKIDDYFGMSDRGVTMYEVPITIPQTIRYIGDYAFVNFASARFSINMTYSAFKTISFGTQWLNLTNNDLEFRFNDCTKYNYDFLDRLDIDMKRTLEVGESTIPNVISCASYCDLSVTYSVMGYFYVDIDDSSVASYYYGGSTLTIRGEGAGTTNLHFTYHELSCDVTLTVVEPTPEVMNLKMWTGFGLDYSSQIESMVDQYNNAHKDEVHVEHTSKRSYNQLIDSIIDSISANAYPNIANGYSDQISQYVHSGIILPLNSYIENYNQTHGVDLMSDFYPEYTYENQNIYFDSQSETPVILGLPFNKCSEVMVANGYLLDIAKSIDPTITVPTTWQELQVVGPKVYAAFDSIGMYSSSYNYIIGQTDSSDHVTSYRLSYSDEDLGGGEKVLQDISHVGESNPFYVCGYDSGYNAFVTLIRDWGSMYSDFSRDIYFASPSEFGRAIFWRTNYQGTNYQEKTLDAMMFVKDLHDNRTFAMPQDLGEAQFCARPFRKGQCLFTICSSGGLSNYLNVADNQRTEVYPIPYYDDGETVRKYVTSQGSSLFMLNQYSSPQKAPEERQASFDAIVDFCTGEKQGKWASSTGYFPASRSAFNSDSYQNMLQDSSPTKLQRAYRYAAMVNRDVYSLNGWSKFTELGFLGSTGMRDIVEHLIRNICNEYDLDTREGVKFYIDSIWNQIDPRLRYE